MVVKKILGYLGSGYPGWPRIFKASFISKITGLRNIPGMP